METIFSQTANYLKQILTTEKHILRPSHDGYAIAKAYFGFVSTPSTDDIKEALKCLSHFHKIANDRQFAECLIKQLKTLIEELQKL